MKISFLGANREVTGSCTMLEVAGKRIIVDCGLQQGSDEKDDQTLPFDAKTVDFVLLTHAHIDHSGRIPLLYKNGFRGKIITTSASLNLCQILLKDSAHIQENEIKWQNRKLNRSGDNLLEPLYSMEDAENVLAHFVGVEYEKPFILGEFCTVKYIDAGHLLGSASIIATLKEDGVEKTLLFSGDIGNINQPIIRNPQQISSADYVIMETTYGNREHAQSVSYVDELANIIDTTISAGGNVVIPSFAVGRTQELLYHIREIKERGLVKNCPNFKVVIDSPLAVEATNIYASNTVGYYDSEAKKLLDNGINPLDFKGLTLSVTTDESKALNDGFPKVIISSSGMCEAGRIRHHLKHNLWKRESTIIFVGFQAIGTLGRNILDGAKTVKLFKETIHIRAKIVELQGMSAHADKSMLFDWLKHISSVEKIFLIHGEESASVSFWQHCKDNLTTPIELPHYLDSFDLKTGEATLPYEAIFTPNNKKQGLFKSVVQDAEHLLSELGKHQGLCNGELRKISKQINDIINHLKN